MDRGARFDWWVCYSILSSSKKISGPRLHCDPDECVSGVSPYAEKVHQRYLPYPSSRKWRTLQAIKKIRYHFCSRRNKHFGSVAASKPFPSSRQTEAPEHSGVASARCRPRFAPYSNTCQGSVMLLRSRSYLLRRSLLTRVVTPMLVQKAAVEDSVLEMLPEYVGLHGGKCSLVWALRREE